jgi:RNA polymerase sigma-70 factor (ECF subfamily)
VLTPADVGRRDRAVSVRAESASTVPASRPSSTAPRPDPDVESRTWLRRLRADGPERDQAISDLRDLLLRAARFEVHRRGATMAHLRGGDHDDLAQHSADDALLSILGKLDSFRGESRFTTWAYKFALLEAAVKLRRRAWQGREIPLESEHWSLMADQHSTPDQDAESTELMRAIGEAIKQQLTPHQREILVALTLNDVPIDVLAERLNTTRGALYKTLHDARRKLRTCLSERGLHVGSVRESQIP